MIDFGALVLGPALRVFGRPITVTPAVSQPGAPAYVATGVYRAQPVDMQAEDGMLVTTTTKHTLGIRRSTFSVQVKAGDTVTLDDGRAFAVDRYHPDGQGGAELTLMLQQPTQATP